MNKFSVSALSKPSSWLNLLTQISVGMFHLSLAITLGLALSPSDALTHEPLGELNDKLLHLLAFSALTTLGMAAWGPHRWLMIAVGLSLLGGGIELLQGMPIIGRDRELGDWLADNLGVALALMGWFALRAFSVVPFRQTNHRQSK